ncbi:lipid-A-disaccharide synthase [Ralstonia pickettii]|nr:lipid-A-disaccharide synthase [Ralstonia mannitolilytica]ATG19999.1 lipid-A-disaccharide synthase [Ralstonia pickettii]CAJ0740289.1 Lipid-A-disaccharide synthase [Ralstonia mannitolilytica]
MTELATPVRRIGMVAGEASGDLLASLLLKGLHAQLPADIAYHGIGGARMAEQGFQSNWPMHKLSVNGYVEVLGQLREILAIRKELKQDLLAKPPLAFIGVDAPDFNFNVEIAMRQAGVPVVHFVSPSIWAWRAGRIKTIAKAVDHILCLFPFEPEIYAKAGIPATYVGHPLADEIPLVPDVEGARTRLGLPLGRKVVAVLPGSRNSEVKHLGPTLFAAMARMQLVEPDLAFVLPAANATLRERIDALRAEHPGLHLWVVDGQSHAAMEAADVILLASGTATLEAALYKKPMVITYKVPWLTAQIMKRKGYLPYVGLPNILSGRFVVPELLQDDATPEALARETLLQLSDHANATFLREHFTQMHLTLKQNMAEIGAKVVVDLLRSRGKL